MKIAVTGGIGSGKSFVCRMLEERGISIYNCDDAAKRLIVTSAKIKRELTALVGENVYLEGRLNKAVLTSFLLKSNENTLKVNGIIHPVVAEDFIASGMKWMECAILFTSGFDRLVDKTICVTAPLSTRVERIMRRDGISEAKAKEWIGIQMPQEEMLKLCDYEVKNDGKADLGKQIDNILNSLKD